MVITLLFGLAQALINDPDLVLLDEPTTGLDPLGTRDMKDLILKLRDEGKTGVMGRHLLADVQDVCDRIAILYEGELKQLGRVEDLLTEQERTQLMTSKLDDTALAEIQDVIQRHGASIESVDHPTSTLEELFLRTVEESRERPGRRVVAEDAVASDVGSASE